MISYDTHVFCAVLPRPPDPGQIILRGVNVTNEEIYLKGTVLIPSPFLFVLSAHETFLQPIQRVRAGFNDQEWKRIEVMVGEQQATPSPGSLLRGEQIVHEVVEGGKLATDRYLFIVHSGKTAARRSKQAAKMHN
jgi:hypothetical protein